MGLVINIVIWFFVKSYLNKKINEGINKIYFDFNF